MILVLLNWKKFCSWCYLNMFSLKCITFHATKVIQTLPNTSDLLWDEVNTLSFTTNISWIIVWFLITIDLSHLMQIPRYCASRIWTEIAFDESNFSSYDWSLEVLPLILVWIPVWSVVQIYKSLDRFVQCFVFSLYKLFWAI